MRAPQRSPGPVGGRTGAAAMLRGGGRGAVAVLRGAAAGGRAASGGGQGQDPDRDPGQGQGSARPLEPSLLRFLVCPLSKRPLR